MAQCEICTKHDHKLDLKACVSCAKNVCPACRGDEGDGYWTHQGKKGYACIDCIAASKAYEGGALAVAREIKAFTHAVLLPEVLQAVDERTKRLGDELVRPVVKDALDRVSELTSGTLREAQGTAENLVVALDKSLRRTLIYVAIVVGLVNAAGILAAVLIARGLAH